MSVRPGKTVLEVINATTAFFQERGIENPRLNIELMLAHVLRKKRLQLYLEFERRLDQSVLAGLREMVRRRANREPLQYILGKTEFYGLDFSLDKRVLIPRPETELLVEHVLAACRDAAHVKILDVGTGSGCLAVTLAKHLPTAEVWATDKSAAALEVAGANAAQHGVAERIHFLHTDLFSADHGRSIDWIISNPPYVPTTEAANLAKEIIDHEPMEALFAGEDGLAVIRAIIAEAPRFLSAGGQVALEVGAGQSEAVQQLFRDGQYQVAKVVKDYQNHERVVIAMRE
jgi:release factor glutamine methyltransferase